MGPRPYCAEIYINIYLYLHNNKERYYYYLSFFQHLLKCTYAKKAYIITYASPDSHADGLIQL